MDSGAPSLDKWIKNFGDYFTSGEVGPMSQEDKEWVENIISTKIDLSKKDKLVQLCDQIV